MLSHTPMKNFPELDSLEAREAERIYLDVRRRIWREPKILAIAFVVEVIAVFLMLVVFRPDSLLETFIAAMLGTVLAFAILGRLVVKPRMHAEFNALGYPPSGAAIPPK